MDDAVQTLEGLTEAPWKQEASSATLNWATPDADQKIGYIARVSNPSAQPDDPTSKLIGFLIRKHHWSPFQMANMCIEITTTRDISAQILRHQSVNFQEFSTRYADVEELLRWKECRFQDTANRQNSFTIDDLQQSWVKDTGEHQDSMPDVEVNGYNVAETEAYWDALVNEASVRGMEGYQEARKRGVAKETARAILPFGLIPTRIYMNATVRSWMHYIFERTKPGVQKEHRDVALACEAVFKDTMPETHLAYVSWKRTQAIMERLYTLFGQDKLGLMVEDDNLRPYGDVDALVADLTLAADAA